MTDGYRTIMKSAWDEIIIEKSKFIGYATPVSSEEEALQFIKEIKAKHWDANHNVHGYIIGSQMEVQRYSDDGEPSGTAGIPVLEVLKKEDLRNAVVVVTRYFGGIKLGAGGLVRAYTKAAKIALDAAKIITKKKYQLIEIKVDYTLLGKLQNDLLQQGYYIKDIIYYDYVIIQVYTMVGEVEEFIEKIIDWTNDKCEIIEGAVDYLTEVEGKIIL
ncbi:YigZ family protein [Alkaliphilus serpentinus]|uniref:YigZ family protein n=1 Tax=Alkaliphilus serpentinus TaxID=1482731 RepID=A0A833HQ60_9FIRM|nr:YigZ family protein [Alkaliphilus serpentinus]KAB3531467.1 YigZ family protein [Alkaliphilus serpentinus]